MFYIRVDGNDTIATGHVRRCLAIADEMKKLGEKTIFITADSRTNSLIEGFGYEIICLESEWDNLEVEINGLLEIIIQRDIKVLLIDSYYVTTKYIEEIRKYTKVIYIDDFNCCPFDVDLLINYNIYAKEQDYSDNTNLALGSKYVPVRKEFQNIKRREISSVNKILITSGGTDNYNVIGAILDNFKLQSWFDDFSFYVIIGKYNKNRECLVNKWSDYPNVIMLFDVTNISYYMGICHIAITAGGTTVYELCACGIPSILYTIADNQLNMARAFDELNLIPWVGDIRENRIQCIEKMKVCIKTYVENLEKMRKVSLGMQNLIDGKGCNRIAKRVKKLIDNSTYY